MNDLPMLVKLFRGQEFSEIEDATNGINTFLLSNISDET